MVQVGTEAFGVRGITQNRYLPCGKKVLFSPLSVTPFEQQNKRKIDKEQHH
jgi:hypothetical protein